MANLNKLRAAMRQSQRDGEDFPDDPWKKAFVDSDGKIQLGRDRGARDGRPKSEVHQGVFAYASVLVESDLWTVSEFLPAGTEFIEVDGQGGWMYDFEDEYGNWYQMFLYHDGSLYQVQVVFPELEGRGYGVHDAHVYSRDSRICLSDRTMGGLEDLQEAYAKSVVWANGFSVFEQTGQFPFSINNGDDGDEDDGDDGYEDEEDDDVYA